MGWTIKLHILLLTCLFSQLRSQTQIVNECLAGWEIDVNAEGGFRCYLIDTAAVKNFDDANRYCSEVTEGYGYLISVSNSREGNFVKQHLASVNRMYWEYYTSGRLNHTNVQNKKDRSFRWVGDGKEFHTDDANTDWLTERDKDGIVDPQSGRPPKVIIYKSTRGEGEEQSPRWGWSFVSEDVLRHFVCEIALEDVRFVKWPRKISYGAPLVEDRYIERAPSFIQQPLNGFYVENSNLKYVSSEAIADGWPSPSYRWCRKKGRDPTACEVVESSQDVAIINGRMMFFAKEDKENPEIRKIDDNFFGEYFCIASNEHGSIVSNVITINQAVLKQFPPTKRQAVSVRKKMRGIIECNPPSYNPSVRFNWYKETPEDFINPERKPHIFVSYNGKLYFSAVQESDGGNYYCRVSLNVPEASRDSNSRRIELVVREGGQAEAEPKIFDEFPSTFAQNPPRLTTSKAILRGQSVRFECVAHGTGKLTYEWNRNDRRLLSDRIEFTAGDWNRSFIISNVQPEDGGIYWCIVRNDQGTVSRKSVTLTVESMPYFVIPLQDRVLDVGQKNFQWRCEASGLPDVTYRWSKNGDKFGPKEVERNETLRGRIEFNRLRNIITFKTLKVVDTGSYQCVAENTFATRYSTKQLKVLSFPPNFNKRPLPANTFATMEQNTTIPCVPEGAPYPKITWLGPSGGEIQVGGQGNIRVLQDDSLYINSAGKETEGVYTCLAVSTDDETGKEIGRANDTTKLSVLEATKFYDRPKLLELMVNDTAVFSCKASTSLQLDLTYIWRHNGRDIIFENETKRYRRGSDHESAGNFSDLVIPRVQFADEGTYECVARTPSDIVTHSAQLSVTGPPGEAYGVVASNETTETVNVFFWPADPHGDEVKGYIVEGWQKYNPQWELYDNITIDQFEKIQGRLHTVVGKQRKLHPYNAYKIRVNAYNSYGMGVASRESDSFETDPTKPRYVPRNVTGGGGKEGTLVLKWDLLPAYNACGPGLAYEVCWKREEDFDADYKCKNKSATEYQHVVMVGQSKEEAYRPYHVKVRAMNNDGLGVFSKASLIYSAEKVPDARPSKLRAISYNATALMVYWNPVTDSREVIGGKLRGYNVDYWKQRNETYLQFKRKTVYGNKDRALIIGLEPHTYYQIEVTVFNGAGNGLATTDKVYQQTLRLPPQFFPTEVHLYPDGSNSIRVTWRGVSTGRFEEPLQGYRVRYWRRGESMMHAWEIDTAKTTEAIIYGLKQNKKYNLRVYGYSRGGEGKMSSPTTVFSIGPHCNMYEDDPEADFVYLCDKEEAERYAGIVIYDYSPKYSQRFRRIRGAASATRYCLMLVVGLVLNSIFAPRLL